MTGALIIALPFALPYFSLRENMPDNTLVGLYATRGEIAAYLSPPAGGGNITYPGLLIGNKIPYLQEIVYPQFIGYTGYLLFLSGIIFVLFTFLTFQRNTTREATYHRTRASRKMIIFLILGGIGFIFSLGPFVFKNGEFVFLPYFYIFKYFPPIRFFRGIFRFNILIILSLCLITSVLLKQVRHKTWRRLLPLTLIVLFIFEYFPVKAKTFHYTYNVPTAKTFYAKVKEKNDIDSLLELPAEAVHGQFYSIFHWKPLYNGVAGYTPFNRRSNFLTLNKVPSPKVSDLWMN